MDLNIFSMQQALSDWLGLLQGPAEPPFVKNSEFASQWQYLFRLIMLVLLMVVTVLTFSYIGLKTSEKEGIIQSFAQNTVGQTRYIILTILIGALFAALYALLAAPMFRVKVTIPQSFFTFLFVLLPWVPIVTLVWVAGIILPSVPLLPIFILLFLFLVFPAVFLLRFSQGISLVSGCSRMRCLASVAIPFVIVYSLMVWATLRSQSFEDELEQPAVNTSQAG
ncbi:MAG TPA: hypothetical protein VL501_00205, partial [Pyrinomonadaceae bacterium]|nr:hypothetical protein [Pyrinomonadaceae bacterium]